MKLTAPQRRALTVISKWARANDRKLKSLRVRPTTVVVLKRLGLIETVPGEWANGYYREAFVQVTEAGAEWLKAQGIDACPDAFTARRDAQQANIAAAKAAAITPFGAKFANRKKLPSAHA